MKKKFFGKAVSLSLALAISCACCLSASAYYDEANAHFGPGGNTNTWVSTRNDVSDMSASKNPVKASDVYFYYKPSTLRELPSNFVASNSRQIKIYLMERDAFGGDDRAKYYEGNFNGRTINSISYKSTSTNEDLEVGRGVELFIEQYVTRVGGDGGTAYTSLFSYYCGIN